MLRELLLNTQKEQRASVRAEEVFKVFNREISKPTPLVFSGKRIFRIVDIKRSYEKVEIFARVFEGKKQIGFGIDGTVDIERFVFVNPPTMVHDPEGGIIIPDYDINGVEKTPIRLREDPLEALHEALQHTVEVMKSKDYGSKIVRGKIGNTTTTIYSNTADCVARYSNASWSTLRGASAGSSIQNLTTGYVSWTKEGAVYNGYQPFHMFDTSTISSGDTISSATFSVYLNGDNAVADSQQMSVCNSTQATWNSIGTGDFDQRGGSTEGATRVSCPSGSTTGYLDFPLNATGLTFIARSGETIPGSASASGKTQLAIRWSSDLDNSTPTGNTYMQLRFADYSGTSSDPKLVVEHSGAVDITVNPSALSSTFSIPSATVSAIQNVSISSSVLSATFSIPSYSVSTTVSLSPSVLSATFSIPTYSVDTPDALVSVGVLSGTFSIPTYSVSATRSVDVTPSVLTATFSVPTYTVQTIGSITVDVSPLSASFSIPTYTATGTENVTISASVLTGTFSIPTYAISLVQTVSSTTLSATFSIPAVTVTAIRNVSLSPSVLILSFVIPVYFARGDFWQEKYAVPNTTWSENFSVPTTNWSDKGYNESNNWLNKY